MLVNVTKYYTSLATLLLKIVDINRYQENEGRVNAAKMRSSKHIVGTALQNTIQSDKIINKPDTSINDIKILTGERVCV